MFVRFFEQISNFFGLLCQKYIMIYILIISLGVGIHIELVYRVLSEELRSLTWTCWLITFIALYATYLIQHSNPGYLSKSDHVSDLSCQSCWSRAAIMPPVCVSIPPALGSSWSYRRIGDDEDMDGSIQVIKQDEFCEYCESKCIARSHHCRRCNQCVARFDHHCDFLEICIGERNHCLFYIYVLILSICCSIALHLVSSCVKSYSNIYEFIVKNLVIIMLRLILYGILWSLGALLIFHSWLIMFNVTTYEVIHQSRDRSLSAYSEGILTNIVKFFSCMSQDYKWNSNISIEWKPVDWHYHEQQCRVRQRDVCNVICFNDYYECC